MNKIAVIPGSFDPITNGHLDIIKRASQIFDTVIVLICTNSAKKGFICSEDRQMLVENAVCSLSNVKVDVTDGLFADYCATHDIDVVVKGVRNAVDYAYEADLMRMNESIFNDKYGKLPETFFMQSEAKYISHSSTFVRELIKYDSDASKYVPNGELLYSILKK